MPDYCNNRWDRNVRKAMDLATTILLLAFASAAVVWAIKTARGW